MPSDLKVNGSYPSFRDLYLNGERLSMSRSEDYYFTKSIDTYTDGDNITYSNGFYVDKEFLNVFSGEDVAPAELCMDIEWTSRRYRISKIEEFEEYSKVFIKDEDWYSYEKFDGNKQSLVKCRYHFENHLALLNEPGEFFYDNVNGIIYLYPYNDTNMNTAVISYPMVENIFKLYETSGLSFQGITFTGITSNFATEHGYNGGLGGVHSWNSVAENANNSRFFKNENSLENWYNDFIPSAAIYSCNSNFISVTNCKFDELGGNGLLLSGGNHSAKICENSFTDIAMSAILAGRQSDNWNFKTGQTNMTVKNNYISNIGTDYNNCPAIYVVRAFGLYVADNKILNTPYSGLMAGWMTTAGEDHNLNNVEISGNWLENNMYALNDGAAIYVCGANSLESDRVIYNTIHDNYIKANAYDLTYTGVYLDMNASNTKVYNNVIDGFGTTHGPVFNQDFIASQYTHNNEVINNFTTVSNISDTSLSGADNSSYSLRNIKVSGNIYRTTFDELPSNAKQIYNSAGIKKDIEIPRNKISAILILNAHETVPVDSERIIGKCVITNNSEKALTFHLNSDNAASYGISVTSESVKVDAGKTSVLPLIFKSHEKKSALLNLKIESGNGYKMNFNRAVKISFSGLKVINTDYITVSENMQATACDAGTEIRFLSNSKWYERVNLSQSTNKAYYYDFEKGFNLGLSNILSGDDTPYSIALCMSAESESAWSDNTGYMLIYSSNGHLEIFKTPGKGTAPVSDKGKSVISVYREPIGDKLSVKIFKTEKLYIFCVNGENYEVNIADDFISAGSTKYLCASVGMLSGTDANGIVDWSKDTPKNSCFIINELS